MADDTSHAVPTAPAEAVTPAGINHLVINVRDIEESHRFWTEILGFKQVGVSARRGGKMRFYSGDHGGGRMNHHDIALVREPGSAGAAQGLGNVRHAVGGQPHRDRDAEPRGVAEAARLSAQQGCQVPPSGQSRHDPQPLYQRPQRLRRRGPVRAAARGLGRRHPGCARATPSRCRPKATRPLSTTRTTRPSARPRSRRRRSPDLAP